MRKLQIVLVIVFAVGVLLGGIGTGIAFEEFSSMKYEGTVYLGEEDLVTGEFIYEFEPVKGEKVVLADCYWGNEDGEEILTEDASVPMGQVIYDITYNPKMSSPVLYFEEAPEETVEESETVPEDVEENKVSGYLYMHSHYVGDEFELLMKNKDQILEDMKQGKFASYRTAYISKVRVRMNPGMTEYIEDRTQG